MFHTGRCGSTVLGDMLAQHPDVFWANEIFNEMTWKFNWNLISRLRTRRFIEAASSTQTKKYYGFEIKFLPEQHLRAECINLSLPALIDLLRNMEMRFIVLLRRNYLRRALSVEVARTTNEWHTNETKSNPVPVKINIDNFMTGSKSRPLIEHFNSIDENSRNLLVLLQDIPFLELYYEDDILIDPCIAYNKVAEFLNIESTALNYKVRLQRTNPFKIEEMIENYDEVASHLMGTKYEWMLRN